MPQSIESFARTTPEHVCDRRFNHLEANHAAPGLSFAGDEHLLVGRPAVYVVGSRKASPAGGRFAAQLARWLVEHCAVVVSGLAEECDTSAHEAAIAAAGRTVAVLGTSLVQSYPAKNRELRQTIMREHLTLSQFPVGAPSRPGNFPLRNRTMAPLSDATVMLEAAEKSGSLHQGWEALRLGRTLFFAARMLEDAALAWTREFERYGALPLGDDDFALLEEFLPEPVDAAHAGASF